MHAHDSTHFLTILLPFRLGFTMNRLVLVSIARLVSREGDCMESSTKVTCPLHAIVLFLVLLADTSPLVAEELVYHGHRFIVLSRP